ncbi:hypothetical protein ACLOJK_014201 [Asimina triloba]
MQPVIPLHRDQAGHVLIKRFSDLKRDTYRTHQLQVANPQVLLLRERGGTKKKKTEIQPLPLYSLQKSMEETANLPPLSEEHTQESDDLRSFPRIPDRPATRSSLQKYSPLEWKGYFDQEDDVTIPESNDVFHIYTAGSEGPVVFCLHGGGYSGWVLTKTFHEFNLVELVPLNWNSFETDIYCSGQESLTFDLTLLFLKNAQLSFALAASKIKEKARVVAMDLRGHGKSSTDNDLDLSIETLCNDVVGVLKAMYGDSPPAIVLVGHSMGGSVTVHVAAKKVISNVAGMVVVDVVEIEWSVKGGSLRNVDSARLSVPSTLRYDDSKKWDRQIRQIFVCLIQYYFIYWLLLLHRPLTIGQMQGKFQMVVVRHTGHAIQEDVPDEFATLVLNFISRNRIGPHGVESFFCQSAWEHIFGSSRADTRHSWTITAMKIILDDQQ